MTLRLAIITPFGIAECYFVAKIVYRMLNNVRKIWNLYGICNEVLAARLMPPPPAITAQDCRIIELLQ